MTEKIVEQIRPYYSELINYYLAVPEKTDSGMYLESPIFFDKPNTAIEKIASLTEENLDSYKISSQQQYNDGTSYILSLNLKSELAGVIGYLYGKYYASEPNPINPEAKPMIVQNVAQNQEQNQQQIIEQNFKLIIEKELEKLAADPNIEEKEKGFLNKLKNVLKTTNNAASFMIEASRLADSLGITLSVLMPIFETLK